jgi:hypothetical protein
LSRRRSGETWKHIGRRLQLAQNQRIGRMSEEFFDRNIRTKAFLEGGYVDNKRIHKGGDRVVQKRDIYGRKIGKPITYEIKTGVRSQLSDAQKKRMKQLGNRYRVIRY